MKRTLSLLFGVAHMFLATEATAADPDRGEELYGSHCAGCHSLDNNRIGPLHRGVFGREAGTVPDFAYSDAVRQSKVIWDTESLDAWLTNPQAFIPGQRMFLSVSSVGERADIIAYLRRESKE